MLNFCPGGFAKVKGFLSKVTDDLSKLMSDLTDATGKIKVIEGNPTVEAIVAAVPVASTVEGYLNSGLDVLAKGLNAASTFAEKLSQWLANETEDGKDMKLVKLAQVSTAIADNKQHPQSFYDTAVQVHIEGLK